MTSSGRSSRLAAVLLATLLFVAAACGTDGKADDAAKKTPATTAAPSTTTTEAAEPTDVTDHDDHDTDVTQPADEPDDDVTEPADDADAELLGEADAQAAVESVNLTIDDLPAGEGWTSEPDDGADDNVFDKCAGEELDLDEHTIAKARGEELTNELEDDAELHDPDRHRLPGRPRSLQRDDRDPERRGVRRLHDARASSTPTTTRTWRSPAASSTADGVPQLGDGLAALQGDFTITHTPSGESAHLGALLILVRTETLVTAVTATAVDTPGDEQLLYGLLDTIADRQADALATA